MIAGLEAIVLADEEARERISFVEKRRDRDLASARAAHDRAAEERREEALAELEREIAAVREESDRELASLLASHRDYLAALAEVGERQLEPAAALYAQIVGGAS